MLFLTVVIAFITERIIEPRLGEYKPADAAGDEPTSRAAALGRGIARPAVRALRRWSASLVVFGLLTLPSGAPLRNPDTGALIGNSPFMNGLIAPDHAAVPGHRRRLRHRRRDAEER